MAALLYFNIGNYFATLNKSIDKLLRRMHLPSENAVNKLYKQLTSQPADRSDQATDEATNRSAYRPSRAVTKSAQQSTDQFQGNDQTSEQAQNRCGYKEVPLAWWQSRDAPRSATRWATTASEERWSRTSPLSQSDLQKHGSKALKLINTRYTAM